MLRIAPMKIEDIAEVRNIESSSFSLPWSKDDFREIILSHTYKPFTLKNGSGQILGYIVFYVAADEGHIMNVVTNARYRRKGIAQKLLDFAHGQFRKAGVRSAYLELRRSNYSAYRLYKKKGYAYVGMRKSYYEDNMEDAILMRKILR